MFFVLFLFCRAPNNDYSPENLQTVNDVVYLNLFDEVVFNILQVRNQFCTTACLLLVFPWLLSFTSVLIHLLRCVPPLQDDRQQSTNIHQRLERHWLGSVEIPFSTIYFNNKVLWPLFNHFYGHPLLSSSRNIIGNVSEDDLF